ncbi:MAG: hypothetical protein ACYTGH_11555, partial [Planctomycetota bacterium]
KLQTEGVDKAKAEAETLLAGAKDEAGEILKDARIEADRVLAKAKDEAEQFEKNATSAVELAARDLLLALEGQVKQLFDNAFKAEIAAELSKKDVLKAIIVDLMADWAPGKAVEVQVSEAQTDQLAKIIQSAVKKELQAGITIKPNRNLTSGFRVVCTEDEVSYEFSDATLAEALKPALSPRVAALLKGK